MRLTLFIAIQMMTIPAAFAETVIALEDAPKKVVETAETTAPGARFVRVTVEVEKGRRIYEFEGEGPNGEHIEIDVYEDGTLEEIEMEIGADELPPAVVEALARTEPGFSITYVETSVRRDGVFIYEIEGTSKNGLMLSFDIREDGVIVNRESAVSS